MKIQGEHTLEAPRQTVWDAVMDPAVIRSIMPGCEDLQQVEDHRFEGVLKIKVGPVQGQFKGSVELSELDPPNSYKLQLKGKGAAGFVDGEGTMRLAESGPRTTTLAYDIDAKVGGRIASVGQRLLDSSSKVIARQAVEGLAQQVASKVAAEAAPEGEETDAAAPPAAAPATPSQAEFAAGFAKGLVAELIPKEKRPVALVVTLVVVLGAALVLFKACGG
jgi:uncharacterized protein